MKHFLLFNWYRLITATAMFIFAVAIFVAVVKLNVAQAGSPAILLPDQQLINTWIVAKGNTIYEVTWNRSTRDYSCRQICEGAR